MGMIRSARADAKAGRTARRNTNIIATHVLLVFVIKVALSGVPQFWVTERLGPKLSILPFKLFFSNHSTLGCEIIRVAFNDKQTNFNI